MKKSHIKKHLSGQIKFGRSRDLCAIGNYLFEDALPLVDQEYQNVVKIGRTGLKTSTYEDFSPTENYAKAREYKKEKWHILKANGRINEFYLWKRIS